MNSRSSGELVLRRAQESDARALADLCTQLGYPTRQDEAAARLRGILRKSDHAVVVAHYPQERIVGFVHVHDRLLVEAAPFAELGGLVVDGEHQRQGVGQRLLDAAERWSAARGLSSIRIRSNVVRYSAHTFYTRMGYRTVKEQTVFSKELSFKKMLHA
jgi:GNAT superfamily N-acetyltransferase